MWASIVTNEVRGGDETFPKLVWDFLFVFLLSVMSYD